MKLYYSASALLIAGLLFMGCSSENGSTSDKSGINSLPLLEYSTAGYIADDEDLMLSGIAQVLIDREGNVLFTDVTQSKVYYFTKDNHLLQQFGGDGRGPGEFQRLMSLTLLDGNRLLATDAMNQNVSEFRLNNGKWEFFETFQLGGTNTGFGRIITDLGNGRLLAMSSFGMDMSSPPPMDEPFSRDMVYQKLDYEGNILDEEFMRVKGSTTMMSQAGGGFQVAMIPFTEMDHLLVGPDGYIYFANNMEMKITKMDADKNELSTFTFDIPNYKTQPSDYESILDNYEGDFRRAIRSAIPEDKPVIRQIRVSDNGVVWARINTETDDQPDWVVFDSNGTVLGSLRFPEGTAVHSIRDNRVYAVNTDEYDVPRIVIYEIGI